MNKICGQSLWNGQHPLTWAWLDGKAKDISLVKYLYNISITWSVWENHWWSFSTDLRCHDAPKKSLKCMKEKWVSIHKFSLIYWHNILYFVIATTTYISHAHVRKNSLSHYKTIIFPRNNWNRHSIGWVSLMGSMLDLCAMFVTVLFRLPYYIGSYHNGAQQHFAF